VFTVFENRTNIRVPNTASIPIRRWHIQRLRRRR